MVVVKGHSYTVATNDSFNIIHAVIAYVGKFDRAQVKMARKKNQNAREHVRTRNQTKSNTQS